MSTYNSAIEVSAEIKARMAQITKANGFDTDIGLTVYAGRVAIEDSQVPCVSIIEGDDLATNSDGRSSLAKIQQRYALVGYAACSPDAPNDTAHLIIRDLKRAIFRTDDKPNSDFARKVEKVEYRGRNIAPRADGAAIVMALIEIDVSYVDQLAK